MVLPIILVQLIGFHFVYDFKLGLFYNVFSYFSIAFGNNLGYYIILILFIVYIFLQLFSSKQYGIISIVSQRRSSAKICPVFKLFV